MDKDEIYRNPALRTGYRGELTGLGVGGPPVRGRGQSAQENRGRRAPPEGSGVVVGSGAAAGGGGSPEDFDSDPQGGGGAAEVFPHEPPVGSTPPLQSGGNEEDAGMGDDRQDERLKAIARRAHEIWLAEGAPDGHDRDHWLRAEAEIDRRSAAGDRTFPATPPAPAR